MESIYTKKHAEIWPSMIQLLAQSGVSNYSIHLDGLRVIGIYECENVQLTQELQNQSEISAQWKEYMKECFSYPPKALHNIVMFLP
jgi:L-rhamnose mutarotase